LPYSFLTTRPVVAFQTQVVLSLLAVTTRRPSGEKRRTVDITRTAFQRCDHLTRTVFHTRAVLSLRAAATRRAGKHSHTPRGALGRGQSRVVNAQNIRKRHAARLCRPGARHYLSRGTRLLCPSAMLVRNFGDLMVPAKAAQMIFIAA